MLGRLDEWPEVLTPIITAPAKSEDASMAEHFLLTTTYFSLHARTHGFPVGWMHKYAKLDR